MLEALSAAGPSAPQVAPAPAVEAGPVPDAVAAPTVSDRAAPSWVRRLRLPAAGVDAGIEPVLTDGQGRMAVPSRPDLVGWYAAGPTPGSPGDAVLDGHLDTSQGLAVFGRLSRTAPGDRLTVQWGAGATLEFVVDSVRLYGYDARPEGLFARDGPARLSLITCAGQWDSQRGNYRQRLVVEAHRA